MAILPKTMGKQGGGDGAVSPPNTLGGVSSLPELAQAYTDLDDDDVAWLQLLQADWQIIADLSFADLVPVSYTHLTLPTIYSV